MSAPHAPSRRPAALAAFLLALLAGLLLAQSASAVSPFPITETFRNTTMGADWHLGGNAGLTAPTDGQGNGWLRLTGATNNQFGYVFDDQAFPSNNGILAEFDYATWGGTGADGIVFFLYDGSTSQASFHAGPIGGSIGYTNCPSSSLQGLSNAYIGVAFDEWGNFSNSTFCNQNGGSSTDLVPGVVAVRGGVASNYQFLTNAKVDASEGGLLADRTQARKIKVAITPDMKLSVYITFPDGKIQTVTSNYQLPANAPATLKMGFVSGTGGSNNNHEIRSTQVVMPADLNTTVTDGVAGSGRGSHTWTATVTNQGPNAVIGATVNATTTLAGKLTNVTWTCAGVAGGTCDQASGTGLPNATADLPVNGQAVYTITGDIASDAAAADLTVDAEQAAGGQTGESDPTDNVATDTSDLTPVFQGPTKPAFSLASNGIATATGNGSSWLGTHVNYDLQWQRCDADGTNCTDIDAATGTTYAIGSPDQGHTIRLKVTGTNAAGSDSTTSDPFTLPDTSIDSEPPALTNVATATFTFSKSGPAGTTFQCSLDGGAYASCVSPKSFSGLADGDHTVSIRAIYGGLTDPTPESSTWHVDLTPPDTTLSGTPGAISSSASFDFPFEGSDDHSDAADLTYQCSVDGGPFTSCTSPLQTTGLSEGTHTVAVRAVDEAGNADPTPATHTWKVDTVAPTTTVDSGLPALGNDPDAEFTFSADEPGVTFECSLDGGAYEPCSSPLDEPGLADGDHTFTVRGTDPAGNLGPESDVYTFTVDTTIHGAITAPDDDAFLGDDTPAIDLTGDEGDHYTLQIDGTQVDAGDLGADGATFTPAGALGDGDHTFELVVTDDAGNEKTASVTVHVDTADPAAPVIGSGPPTFTNDDSPVFDVTGEPEGTLLCRLDGGDWATCPVPLVFGDLPEGEHTVDFKVRDRAGNESPVTTRTFTVDESTSLDVTGPAPGNIGTSHPTVTAKGEPGSTVTIEVDGVVVATGVVGDDGTVAITLPQALRDGDHTIRTTVTDPAGNSASGETKLHVDTQAPGTPSIPQGPASTSSSHDATFTFDGERGSTFKCSIDGGPWQECTPPLTLAGLPDGPHTLSVIATDATGNDSPRQDYTWTVDTTGPAAPPTIDLPATTTTSSSARFAFSLDPGATLECALDDGPFVPCPATVEFNGLKSGGHTLRVRQIDAAGNTGTENRYTWTVAADARARLPRKLSAHVAAHATASASRRIAVGCVLDSPSVTSCRVTAYHGDGKGKRVVVGHGVAKVAKSGHRAATVQVALNATGRRLLGRAIGGMTVRLAASANARGVKHALAASTSTVLYPQRLLVLPTINPFVFDSTKLINKASERALRTIAGEIRNAKTVTCVGNTDAQGSDAYNMGLGLRRAQTVCSELSRLGVKAKMNATSAGERHPRATNATEAGRRANRRVELRIGY